MIASIVALFGFSLFVAIHAVPVDVLVSPPATTNTEGPAPEGPDNPQFNAGGFEGDIILPEGYYLVESSRGVAIYGSRQWPGGIIPYDMSAITGIDLPNPPPLWLMLP